MIEYQTFCQIRLLADEKHLTAVQIAAELKLNIKTVEKWLTKTSYQPRLSRKRPSKLDSFKGQIVAMLERHPYTAQQVFQELKRHGYSGGYSILKEFIRQVRPARKPAYLSLQFAPGECAQVDWGTFGSVRVGSTHRRLSFFVMVLCSSRMMYLHFTLSQSMEQFLWAHRQALEFFGGVPRKVMVDNMKTAVLHHPFGAPAQFHPRYLDFAAHYGFTPVACGVRKAHEKGRVESGVKYVKQNFLAGLDIPSFQALPPAALLWLNQTANLRLHAETRRKPSEMFEEEKSHLGKLPVAPYDCAVLQSAPANSQSRVVFETNRYSVPHLYASQKLTLKIWPERLCLYHHEKLIATHPRSYERRKDILDPDHQKELVAQRLKAREQTLLLAFLGLSPLAETYVRKLQEKRLNAPHHIQKIVALSEIYGADQLARALEDAIAFEAYGCEYIANILEQRQRVPATPSALHLTRRQDLLDLEVPPADLTPYQAKPEP